MPEILISGLVSTVVVVGAASIFNQLEKKSLAAKIQTEFLKQAQVVEAFLRRDIENVVRFSDYIGLQAFGLLQTDQFGVTRMSDALSIFVFDNVFSEASQFQVTGISSVESGADQRDQLTVNLESGPSLNPLKPLPPDADKFSLSRGRDSRILLLEPGQTREAYGLIVHEETPVPLAWKQDFSGDLSLSRTNLIVYIRSRDGLFRMDQNSLTVPSLIAKDIHSIRYRLWFSDLGGPAEAACEAFNQAPRNFELVDYFIESDHSPCTWNHLQTLRVEIVFVSRQNIFEATVHPHYGGEPDRRLKYLHSFSVSPRSYKIWRDHYADKLSSISSGPGQAGEVPLDRVDPPRNTSVTDYHGAIKTALRASPLLSKDKTLNQMMTAAEGLIEGGTGTGTGGLGATTH